MPTALRLVLLSCIALTVPSCIAVSKESDGNPIPRDRIEQIVPGQTTRAEVLEMLGAPLAVERADVTGLTERLISRVAGEDLALTIDPALFDELYIYRRTVTERFGISLLVYNRLIVDRRSDRLTILFDPEGVVLGVGWTPGTD